MLLAAVLAAASGLSTGDVVIVDRDDVEIESSCRVRMSAPFIRDVNGDGVIHVTAPGITIEFETPLRGAPEGPAPDTLTGVGVAIRAPGVTVRGATVSGFRVGIAATGASGLVIEDCDVSDNFAQRLLSTPAAEAGSDWLWPHENDEAQWRERYGAGLWIERSDDVTVRRVRARRTQNGIVLSRVNDSRLYDNDCSFLSGWGLAMWRSSRNSVTRNALDFCVRGYSHGVYNRGQDSAGLLMFEQCSDNLVAENSITHGGDGVFAFAGREALGEANARPDVDGVAAEWYDRRGNNRNHFLRNDLSDAVAHGLELTFSFDNAIVENRFADNGICGIWGGYSQDTLIARNMFARNGSAGYGLERGGVNIEHGRGNQIIGNVFADNRCGVHLWWDPDEGLMALPWARRNERGCDHNVIVQNRFDRDEVAAHLRDTGGVTMFDRNSTRDVPEVVRLEGNSSLADFTPPLMPEPDHGAILGDTRPVGARRHLEGREHIVMGPFAPYDWVGPFVQPVVTAGATHRYRMHGAAAEPVAIEVTGDVDWHRANGDLVVTARPGCALAPYVVEVETTEGTLRQEGRLTNLDWTITVFAWTVDPREDEKTWRAEGLASGITTQRDALALVYAMGGPESVLGAGTVPDGDRFGTLASTTVTLEPGTWRIVSRSDDGVRVRIDDSVIIDDWTWHAPTVHEATFVIGERRAVRIDVEHFELDGYAVLEVDLVRDP